MQPRRIHRLMPEDEILIELGDRLTRARKQRSLSQEALARLAGIGVATRRRLEDGNDAQLGTWLKLLKALGMEAGIDALLPPELPSPMHEATGKSNPKRPRKRAPKSSFQWGDEA